MNDDQFEKPFKKNIEPKIYKYKTQYNDDELIENEWHRKVTGSLYRKGYRIEVDHIAHHWFQWGVTIYYYYVPERGGRT